MAGVKQKRASKLFKEMKGWFKKRGDISPEAAESRYVEENPTASRLKRDIGEPQTPGVEPLAPCDLIRVSVSTAPARMKTFTNALESGSHQGTESFIATAADQVFATTELLERILVNLPLRDPPPSQAYARRSVPYVPVRPSSRKRCGCVSSRIVWW